MYQSYLQVTNCIPWGLPCNRQSFCPQNDRIFLSWDIVKVNVFQTSRENNILVSKIEPFVKIKLCFLFTIRILWQHFILTKMQWETRHQQKKAKKRYNIIYPKFKKEEYSVREVNVGCTYGISSFIFLISIIQQKRF